MNGVSVVEVVFAADGHAADIAVEDRAAFQHLGLIAGVGGQADAGGVAVVARRRCLVAKKARGAVQP